MGIALCLLEVAASDHGHEVKPMSWSHKRLSTFPSAPQAGIKANLSFAGSSILFFNL